MNLKRNENPLEMVDNSDPFDNIKVLGDQCYCKYHEHDNDNSCA